MAKTYTGRDGSLLLGDTTQIKVANWSMQANMETLDNSTLGQCKRTFVPGLKEFNGSATLLYYKDDAGRNDASAFLRRIIKTTDVSEADKVRLTLRLSDGGTNQDITVDAYITSASIGASVGEVSRAEISFQVTGNPISVTI